MTLAALSLRAPGATAQAGPPISLADAIRTTLQRHPQLGIQQQQVEIQRGALRSAAGQFDWQILADGTQSRAYRPLTAYQQFVYGQYDKFNSTAAVTNTSQVVAGASKQYRNGLIVTPNISALRLTNNLENRQGINQGNAQISFTIPLLRGRGRTAVDAQEMAADRQVAAAISEVNESVENLLATVASSYWNVVAAQKLLDALRDSEARARSLVENTQHLIEADRLPRADAFQVLANQALRQANRISGEQHLLEARQQLAVDMGLATDDVTNLPDTATTFPVELAPEQIPHGDAALLAYVQLALDRRPELAALKKREEASQITARAAATALRPQLDVTIAPGVSGLYEGSSFGQFLKSPAHSAQGMDLSGAITYRFPIRRDAAQGAKQSADAAAKQVSLQYQDTARRTAAAVVPSLAAFHSEALQFERTRASVSYYRNALDAERERLSMGQGTVINVVNLEDQLMNATQTEVNAELEYAQALVRLRLATSTIVDANAAGGAIDPQVFFNPPALPVHSAPARSQSGVTP